MGAARKASRALRALSLVACVLALAACDSDVSNGGGSANIVEYHLKDGTRCAVLIGSSKGAIDCDWRR